MWKTPKLTMLVSEDQAFLSGGLSFGCDLVGIEFVPSSCDHHAARTVSDPLSCRWVVL
jgi:hypothetical protein